MNCICQKPAKVRQLALTLSDAGFFELQKRGGVGWGGTLYQQRPTTPFPLFHGDVQTCSVVEAALVEFLKLFRTITRPRPLTYDVIVYLIW